VQGYNAQAVVTETQIVVAAELTQAANDVQQLQPMLRTVEVTLAAAEIPDRPGTVLADSGYWSIANLTTIP
jgi:Transposase DDE domain